MHICSGSGAYDGRLLLQCCRNEIARDKGCETYLKAVTQWKIYSKDAMFNYEEVELCDFGEGWYYSVVLFAPFIVRNYCIGESLTANSHASDCERLGMQSYRTNFHVIRYDANHQLYPIAFADLISRQNMENRIMVLRHIFKGE